jgi:hypothetical protein
MMGRIIAHNEDKDFFGLQKQKRSIVFGEFWHLQDSRVERMQSHCVVCGVLSTILALDSE